MKISSLAKLSPPQYPIQGSITLPGSKYSANRALCIAAFTPGRHIINNVPFNNDIQATINALRNFSISIIKQSNSLIIDGQQEWRTPSCIIDCQDNGTLARFICALSARLKYPVTITGSSQLCKRPMTPLIKSLRMLGANISNDSLPLTIRGPITHYNTSIDPQQSSQYISALLLLKAALRRPLHIDIINQPSSKHYIELTKYWIKKFSINNEHDLCGDIISAGYFLAGSLLTQGSITINNFPIIKHEAERDFLTLLQKIGATINISNNKLSMSSAKLINSLPPYNLQHLPDSVPTLSILQAFTNKVTTFSNIGHLQYKECNRLQQLVIMLQKIGYNASCCSKNLYFKGGEITENITLDPANDHRMAMALALVGLRKKNIYIANPKCVNKSLPEFWQLWEQLGVKVCYDNI